MQASIAQNTAACEEVSKQIEDMQEVSMCISICVIYNASGELKLASSPKARFVHEQIQGCTKTKYEVN